MRSARYLAVCAALCAFAQSSRDSYRSAYRAWRQSDPNLERDAGARGSSISQRAGRVAAEAEKYGTERSSFLRKLTDEQTQNVALLENAAPPESTPALTKGLSEYVAAERVAVSRNVDTLSNDPDKAIQLLRQVMERESAALATLGRAAAERQKAADAAQAAAATLGQARLKALEQSRDLATGLKQASQESDRETAAWAEYYKRLSEAGAGASATPTSRVVPPVSSPARPAMPSVAPVPLSRYVGAWTFVPANALYHGPQPEFMDLVVRDNDGRAEGTLFARFKLPWGGATDPVVRFDFSGDFKNARNQVFNVETGDGSKGTIELIPGPAFNLLEVNFQAQPKFGKIRQANVVLVKK